MEKGVDGVNWLQDPLICSCAGGKRKEKKTALLHGESSPCLGSHRDSKEQGDPQWPCVTSNSVLNSEPLGN